MQVRNEAMPWLAEQTEYGGLSRRENCEAIALKSIPRRCIIEFLILHHYLLGSRAIYRKAPSRDLAGWHVQIVGNHESLQFRRLLITTPEIDRRYRVLAALATYKNIENISCLSWQLQFYFHCYNYEIWSKFWIIEITLKCFSFGTTRYFFGHEMDLMQYYCSV